MKDREDRFRGVFTRCYTPLLAYARRRCTPTDADDLVADVLTVAWRRLDDVPRNAELPWLFGVAHRTLANQQRAARRRLRLVDRLQREAAVPHEPSAVAAVVDVLARLSLTDREILRLSAWEQLRPREIAVVLDCSPDVAAVRLSRARARFREQLLQGSAVVRTGRERKDADD